MAGINLGNLKLLNIVRESIGYILAICLILSTNSVYYLDLDHPKIKEILLLGICISLVAYAIINIIDNKKINLVPSTISMLVILVYFLIFYLWIYHHDGVPLAMNYIYALCIIPMLAVLFGASTTNINNILIKLYRVIVILAIISLLGWIASQIHLGTNSDIYINWGNKIVPGYYKVHYIAQGSVNFLGLDIIRNTGIFCEAPMYGYVLTIAFAIDRLILKRTSWRTLVLFITILTTISYTAIFMIIVILFISFYRKDSKKMKAIKIIISFLFALVLIMTAFYMLSLKQKNMNGSLVLRMDDLKVGIDAWLIHPFIGNGTNVNNVLTNLMNPTRWGTLNANYSLGLPFILAFGGLFLALIYILPVFLKRYMKHGVYDVLLVNVCCLLILIIPFVPMYNFLSYYIVGTCLNKYKGD